MHTVIQNSRDEIISHTKLHILVKKKSLSGQFCFFINSILELSETNMAPFMPFRVILVIEWQHNTWTNMIVKMIILMLLGSSDDKEKEKIGVAKPEGPPLRGSRGSRPSRVSGQRPESSSVQGTRIEAFCYHRLNRRRAKWTHRCNHREGLRARVLHRMNRRYRSYIRRCIGRWRPRKIPTPVEPTMHRSIASVQLSREVVFGGTWSYSHRLNWC